MSASDSWRLAQQEHDAGLFRFPHELLYIVTAGDNAPDVLRPSAARTAVGAIMQQLRVALYKHCATREEASLLILQLDLLRDMSQEPIHPWEHLQSDTGPLDAMVTRNAELRAALARAQRTIAELERHIAAIYGMVEQGDDNA